MKDNNNNLVSLYSDENLFNLYLAKITDAYNKNSRNTREIIDKYVSMMDKVEKEKNNKIKMNPNMDLLYVILVCFIIVLLGLFNLETFGMYFFGSVFFFAGIFIGLFVPIFGLIFLFSHGMVGLGLMLSCFEDNLFSPIYSDVSGNAYNILFGLAVILGICGLIFTILHNIGILKKYRFGILIPFVFFALCIFVCGAFPYLFNILN